MNPGIYKLIETGQECGGGMAICCILVGGGLIGLSDRTGVGINILSIGIVLLALCLLSLIWVHPFKNLKKQ